MQTYNPMRDYNKIINHKLSDAIDFWYSQAFRSAEPFYLYYSIPVGAEFVGGIVAAIQKPDGYILASPVRFDGSKSKSQNWHIFRECLNTLPLLNPNL